MTRTPRSTRGRSLRRLLAGAGLSAILCLAAAPEARAFCGFYVGKADASLYNDASQVALVRSGTRTVISMMNDYKGDLNEFALVVPVPVVLEKEQIHVGTKSLFEHLDAYSAPRLVEYFDGDPCRQIIYDGALRQMAPMGAALESKGRGGARSLGVTIEAQYTVGEYDIVILSARESDGLETWLIQNGYRIPRGASRALQPYIRQNMKFFVARVNLKEQAKTGVTYLRPLQFAFESAKFMLPIRLGMVNARGPQDLVIYLLTKNGRVEATNYRTVKLPTGMDVPEYVKDRFPDFYRAMFGRQLEREDGRVVFTEYVWNMGWCDPCAADPLSLEELRDLGVFWLDGDAGGGIVPLPGRRVVAGGGPVPVILTRLHVRYTPETFPEDLVFQETQDHENFQGRYALRHAWKGDPDACPAARAYFEEVQRRREEEAGTLASLTGWDVAEIRAKMALKTSRRWWEDLWR